MYLASSLPALRFLPIIFCLSAVLPNHFAAFRPSNILDYVTLIAYHLKWAFNYLLRYSFSNDIRQYLPPIGEELGVDRYNYKRGDEEEVECPVCLCGIEEGEEIRKLRCDHIFHGDCLERWMGYKHVTCPLCRGSLFSRPTETELGVEVVFFRNRSFTSREREAWWLR